MIASTPTNVLVSPNALVLSLLHAGGGSRVPVAMARSPRDFMRRLSCAPPTVAIVGRGWLSELDLRRLALRRVFSPSPRLFLVLGRGEEPTAFEWKYFDAVIVAGELFLRSARSLQALVAAQRTARLAN